MSINIVDDFISVFLADNINIGTGFKIFLKKIISRIVDDPVLGKNLNEIESVYFHRLTYSSILKIKVFYRSSSSCYILKILKIEDGACGNLLKNEWDNIKNLKACYPGVLDEIIDPRFYFEVDNYAAILMDAIEGDTLENIIREQVKLFHGREGLKIINKYFFNCGKWLKKFQDITKTAFEHGSLEDDLLNKILSQLSAMKEFGIFAPKTIERIVTHAHARWEAVPRETFSHLVGTHSDFIPVNIFVEESTNKQYVLDFSNFKHSIPQRDLGSFVYALDFLSYKSPFFKKIFADFKKSFLAGYGLFKNDDHFYVLSYLRAALGHAINLYHLSSNSFPRRVYSKFVINKLEKNLNKLVPEGTCYEEC